jgi:HSP20 family molecular chaperone IbpA
MNQATCNPSTVTPQYKANAEDHGVTLQIDLPGATKKDLTITSEKQQLTIQAVRNTETPSDWSLLNQTQRPENYKLKLNIHPDLDLSTATATFELGVLRLKLNKREENLPRQIDITN